MSVEELLALPPNDTVERWLFEGALREYPVVPYRNRYHTETMALTTGALLAWRNSRPAPRGKAFTGDVGFRIPTEPPTLFRLDIASVSPETLATTPANATILHGAPALAIEIPSPSDTHEQTKDKLRKLLDAGTPLVWIMDTDDRTVTAYRPGAAPRLDAASQTIDA
jgi:Uma2 family endonuclease